MSTVAVTQVIDAAPARVWAVLVDLAGRRSWLSAVDGVEVLTPGPFGAGTIWRETRTVAGGDDVTEEFRVTEFEPGSRFVVCSPGSGATYRMTYTVAPVRVGRHRGGSTVTIEQEGHASGPTGRVLELVLGGLAARTAEGALRQELTDLARAAAGVAKREPAA
jgi:uncharacterized protein YndB with AHSA1/START domain